MCFVGSFRWQSELYVLGGKVSYWVLEVVMCAVGSFRWQSVLLGLLRGNVCWCTL